MWNKEQRMELMRETLPQERNNELGFQDYGQ